MVAGSLIGGIKETQEMLDFCGKHNITSTIEKIPIDYVNTALDRMLKVIFHFIFFKSSCSTMLTWMTNCFSISHVF